MTQTKQRPIVITGGGTGGHITPALAVADALKARGQRVIFIGSQSGPEGKLVKAAGYQFYGIQAGKLRRYWSLENIVDFFRVGIGWLQARNLLARLKPSVVFAKGGYVSVPVAYAAAFLEVPVVAHESDVVMGLANRLVMKKAEVICTGFPLKQYPVSLQPKLHFTGNPIRRIFQEPIGEESVWRKKLKLIEKVPTLLILGGSQGAHTINQLIIDQLERYLADYQIFHLTGARDLNWAQSAKAKLPANLKKRYQPYGFVDKELPAIMRLADLVIARSSASVLSELAFLGRPTMLIPLPSAASDHQRANAQVFAKKGAAVVLEETELTAEDLFAKVAGLMDDKAERTSLSRAIRFFSSPAAADLIADQVLSVAS